ncbi:MAG: glycosyl hydrolase [Bacteroidota bacterium]
MKKILFLLLLVAQLAHSQYNTAKPWAYWWWMGSAVSKEGIKQNLADYAEAGFGGMHIIPIYGVKGEEKNFIPYLSPEWFEMLDYTCAEAKKVGLGIDMTLGSGWPFGGPQVNQENAAKSFKINEINGIFELKIDNTNQKVKRAAPGGEGLVVDHFDKQSVQNYLKPFETFFSKKNYPIRAFYNDSYEAYGANWTVNFYEKFKKLRGYDISQYLNILVKNKAETEIEKRIWGDYNETISDLLYTEFNPVWTGFAKKYGKLTRNEAHGSPANILDLYAQTDLPETEFFGSKSYDIPLYRQDPNYEESRFGRPGNLVLKLASSPANVVGKKLVSSETATWLGNHFKVSLSQIKPIIDESFVGGVNHIFYHGMPYTPPNEPFPGWLFYASTNFNQNSHFWKELAQLNKYIENCQNLLQNSKADNDILFYLPMYDLWQQPGPNNQTHAINVHTILNEGMFSGGLGKLAHNLVANGFSFDFVSDKQIAKSKIVGKEIVTEAGQKYTAVVVPKTEVLSLETLTFFKNMAQKGLKIYFENQLPSKVNGFNDWQKRQDLFEEMAQNLGVNVSSNLIQSLKNENVKSEMIAENGLSYIRKKTKTGHLYFITNLANSYHSNSISLSSIANSVQLYDPLTNSKKFVTFRKLDNGKISIPLVLNAGQSVFVETFDKKVEGVKISNPEKVLTNKIEISGNWKIDFLNGMPYLPGSYVAKSLQSWANNSDTARQYFSGTAKYTIDFELPQAALKKAGFIDLGDVRESAKVKLNGVDLGISWCLPFQLNIPQNLLKKSNKLEIEVTNLSANRIRFMDKKGMPWRKFYDINMVDINYKSFDASGWQPVDSGILGPVFIRY